jgi:hypothetical protein
MNIIVLTKHFWGILNSPIWYLLFAPKVWWSRFCPKVTCNDITIKCVIRLVGKVMENED